MTGAIQYIPDLIAAHAARDPDHPALIHDHAVLRYGDLQSRIDGVAGALQARGVGPGGAVAICAATSIDHAVLFLATVRAGAAVAPIAPSSTPEAIAGMVADCGAALFAADDAVTAALAGLAPAVAPTPLADAAARAAPLTPPALTPDLPFNIIYSSGTTGAPKGIVQSHAMRWRHVERGAELGYAPDAVTLLSTPLYSNTTLVSFLPTLAGGGTVVLQAKFDAGEWLRLAARHRATHTMLVPVQYRRLLAHPAFDAADLSSLRLKFATSAPFDAGMKAEVLRRMPGGLIEYFGMTEGGGGCVLVAHAHPAKLHTVGHPLPGHDIRLIDDDGVEVPVGAVGEIVGRSDATMLGYHGRAEATRAAQWTAPDGRVFVRTGDVGRFDADGFLQLMDRKKDMVISGGFNVYPSDLEAVLVQHPAVVEAAVVACPSAAWGETPVGFAVLRDGAGVEEVRDWANARLGKTQRLAALHALAALPRSAIGKVLKRELRDRLEPLP